jgi:hypothetical protein
MDSPEPFQGRPNPGGRLDPLDPRTRTAMDAKQRASELAYSDRHMASFAQRFPGAARIKVV